MASGSPGVFVFERDSSRNISASGATSGGFVGSFNWGEIDIDLFISDENELVQYLGKPNNVNYVDWFSAQNFLQYTGSLRVRRITSSAAKNASSGATGVLIKNKTMFDMQESTLTEHFYARYAGDLGNSIAVSFADKDTFDTWKYKSVFDTPPGSSHYSETYLQDANDEMHVVVVDKYGKITGVPGDILETYAYVSKARDGKDINNQISYYKTVINRKSNYIYVGNPISGVLVNDIADTHSAFGDTYIDKVKPFTSLKEATEIVLKDGNNGGLADKSAYVDGYSKMCMVDDNSVNVIFAGNCGGDENYLEVVNAIGQYCKKSQKRVGFCSPKMSDIVGISDENTIRKNIINTWESIVEKHSYMSMATGIKMIYDKYNDVYRWIPTNSDEAGIWVKTHNNEGKWVSAAGYSKGVYTNALALAYNPDEQDRNQLYSLGINCVIQEKGAGILLLGDKTLQGKNSTFSFLGTRFLFIELRNIIAEASKYVLFEFNDDFTRSQFKDLVIPTLRDIKGKRGLHNFTVICDETNNTPKVIQDGEFVGDIYIKPNYSIQQVMLTFTAVNRTLSFEEVILSNKG